MATSVNVQHECDRCHTVASVTGRGNIDTAAPAGWHLFMVTGMPHLWCPACMDGLQRFREANEAVEQSR